MSHALSHAKQMLEEFEHLLAEREKAGSDAKGVAITLRRASPPAGELVATPFGRGEIANVTQDDKGYRVVAYVDLRRAISTLRTALASAI